MAKKILRYKKCQKCSKLKNKKRQENHLYRHHVMEILRENFLSRFFVMQSMAWVGGLKSWNLEIVAVLPVCWTQKECVGWGTQIMKPRDKPQWIVAQRPLSSHTILGSVWMVFPGFRTPSHYYHISVQSPSLNIIPTRANHKGLCLFEWDEACALPSARILT